MSMTSADELREEVRRRYAESARAVTEGSSCGCGSGSCCDGRERRGEVRRGAVRRRAARRAPGDGGARLARLRQPDRGGRAARGRDGARPRLRRRDRRDPLGEARRRDRDRVRARHDRRDARARASERAGGRGRATSIFLKGVIEEIPLPADSVDVVISNCVINLSVDKPAVLTEIARVLKPGGRIGISDVVAEDRLIARRSGRARQLRRLHRRCALEGRVRGRARGSRASSRSASSSPTRSPTECTARSSRR